MYMRVLLILSVAFATVADAEKLPLVVVPQSLLGSLRVSVADTEGQIGSLDVERLTSSYGEGKLIEQRRDLLLRIAKSLRGDLDRFERDHSLTTSFFVLLSSKDLASQLDAMSGSLACPTSSSTTAEQVRRRDGHADKMVDLCARLSSIASELQTLILAASRNVETELMNCRP